MNPHAEFAKLLPVLQDPMQKRNHGLTRLFCLRPLYHQPVHSIQNLPLDSSVLRCNGIEVHCRRQKAHQARGYKPTRCPD